jgi:hypothetical protein
VKISSEPVFVFAAARVSFSELELSDDELDDRCVTRFVSLSDDDDELVLSDRLNTNKTIKTTFVFSYLIFSFFVDFFVFISESFPRCSFE